MDDYIAPKLPNRIIPVSKGCDRVVSIRRRDPDTGDPIDWDAEVFMLIDIIPGQRYAFATHEVGTTRAILQAVQQEAGPLTQTPRLSGAVWGPAGGELPASVSAGAVSVFWHTVYLVGLAS